MDYITYWERLAFLAHSSKNIGDPYGRSAQKVGASPLLLP